MISSELAIEVSNLTKSYKLYSNPRDRLQEALHPFRKKYHSSFEALKNISFKIPEGQILGIIGKNGSGKSTLLKIITGVLTPTTGEVKVRGRIAALLELGAGFNPDLTGRENIYLNGSLMGYSDAEMRLRLDEIITFADIGGFLDQAVRMYSSGMFVRLAFAVAISVDPDILIIDEALSVGDLRFQQKCIRKIQEFFERGKTVIFVGHDLAAMKSFCSHCIWINEGELMAQGSPQAVTKEYVSFMAYGMRSIDSCVGEQLLEAGWLETSQFESFGDRQSIIKALRVVDQWNRIPSVLQGGENLLLEFSVECFEVVEEPIFGVVVKDRLGNNIFGGNTFVHNIDLGTLGIGRHFFQLSFIFPFLSNGDYSLTIGLASGHQQDHSQKHWIHDCFIFKVMNPNLRFQNADGLVMENNFDFKKLM